MTLYQDSRPVITMTDNSVNRKGSRHIDTLKYFIGELLFKRILSSWFEQFMTDQMVSDDLTKNLPVPAFLKNSD